MPCVVAGATTHEVRMREWVHGISMSDTLKGVVEAFTAESVDRFSSEEVAAGLKHSRCAMPELLLVYIDIEQMHGSLSWP